MRGEKQQILTELKNISWGLNDADENHIVKSTDSLLNNP